MKIAGYHWWAWGICVVMWLAFVFLLGYVVHNIVNIFMAGWRMV